MFLLALLHLKKHFAFLLRYSIKTIWPVRLGARTSGFHPGNSGSIPLRATTNQLESWFFLLPRNAFIPSHYSCVSALKTQPDARADVMGLEGWGRQIYLRLDDLRFSNEFLIYDLRFFNILLVNRQSHNSIVTPKSFNRKLYRVSSTSKKI